MSHETKTAPPPSSEPLSKGVGFDAPAPARRPHLGRKRVPIPLSPELDRAVSAAARAIRRCHKAELSDRTKADRAARKFRLFLTSRRRPGRPRSQEVARALKMCGQGKSWAEIYPVAIEGYAQMDQAQRWYRCYNLRRAVKAIIKRGKKVGRGPSSI